MIASRKQSCRTPLCIHRCMADATCKHESRLSNTSPQQTIATVKIWHVGSLTPCTHRCMTSKISFSTAPTHHSSCLDCKRACSSRHTRHVLAPKNVVDRSSSATQLEAFPPIATPCRPHTWSRHLAHDHCQARHLDGVHHLRAKARRGVLRL